MKLWEDPRVVAGMTAQLAERRQRLRVEDRERALRRSLCTAEMHLAQKAWEMGNVERVLELLESYRPQPGKEDLRGFEWYYFWRLCHDDRFTLEGHANKFEAVAFSPGRQDAGDAGLR